MMAGAVTGVCMLGMVLLSGCRDAAPAKANKSTPAGKPIVRTVRNGPVELTVRVSKNRVTVAERLQLTLEARAPKSVTVELPPVGATLGAFNVRDCDEPPVTKRGDDRIYRRQYELDALEAGTQVIDPIEVTWRGTPDEGGVPAGAPSANSDARDGEATTSKITTQSIEIEVDSLLEGPFDPAKFRDVKGEATLTPDRTWAWIAWAVGAVGVVLGMVLATRWWLRRQAQPKPVPPPHVWAMGQLDALLDEKLIERGEVKRFYYRLSRIVRTYIELRFGLMAPERTTEEFLAELRVSGRLLAAHKSHLGAFLEACDRVKYALYKPGRAEVDRVVEAARTFVRETAPVAVPPDEKTPVAGGPKEQAA